MGSPAVKEHAATGQQGTHDNGQPAKGAHFRAVKIANFGPAGRAASNADGNKKSGQQQHLEVSAKDSRGPGKAGTN